MALGARLWEDRKQAYVNLLSHLLDLMGAVEDTFPQIRVAPVGDQPQPADQEQDERADEQLTDQRARLREMEAAVEAFGSHEVVELTRSFMQKSRDFGFDVGTFKMVRDQAGPGEQTAQAYARLNASRQELRDLYQQLAGRIRAELTEAQ